MIFETAFLFYFFRQQRYRTIDKTMRV